MASHTSYKPYKHREFIGPIGHVRRFIGPIVYTLLRHLVVFYIFFHCIYQYTRGKYETMMSFLSWEDLDDERDICLIGGHYVPLVDTDIQHTNGEDKMKTGQKLIPQSPEEDDAKEEKKEEEKEEEITEILVDLN